LALPLRFSTLAILRRIVRSMAAFMFPSIWSQFKINLLLQIFDGLFTYHVLTLGVPELNPLVRDAISVWGEIWGLVYWKLLACVSLGLIFVLRHFRESLTLKALTLTSTVYGCLLLVSVYHFLRDLFI
jgi:hypothetical protein